MARALVAIVTAVSTVTLGTPRAARADDYYVTLFCAESVPYKPTSTHSFASIVRVPAGGPAEVDAICWGPASMKIRGLTLKPEEGANLTVPAVLDPDPTNVGISGFPWVGVDEVVYLKNATLPTFVRYAHLPPMTLP